MSSDPLTLVPEGLKEMMKYHEELDKEKKAAKKAAAQQEEVAEDAPDPEAIGVNAPGNIRDDDGRGAPSAEQTLDEIMNMRGGAEEAEAALLPAELLRALRDLLLLLRAGLEGHEVLDDGLLAA